MSVALASLRCCVCPSICRPRPGCSPSPFDPPVLPIQFEYQQAQLEAEIENLSWKVERADSYDRGVSAALLLVLLLQAREDCRVKSDRVVSMRPRSCC